MNDMLRGVYTMNDDKQRTTGITMIVPQYGGGKRVEKLSLQMGKMLKESGAELGECAHAALCVACAFYATSGNDAADLANKLSKMIRRLVDANRKGRSSS
jgi:hypothetical protein